MVYACTMPAWVPLVSLTLLYAFLFICGCLAARFWARFFTYARRQGKIIASKTSPTQEQAEQHALAMIQSLEESTVNDWKVVIKDAWTGEEIRSVHADQPEKAFDR